MQRLPYTSGILWNIAEHDGKVGFNTVDYYNGFPVFWLAVFSMAWYKCLYLRIDGVIRPVSMERISLGSPDNLLCVIQHKASKDYQPTIRDNRLKSCTDN